VSFKTVQRKFGNRGRSAVRDAAVDRPQVTAQRFPVMAGDVDAADENLTTHYVQWADDRTQCRDSHRTNKPPGRNLENAATPARILTQCAGAPRCIRQSPRTDVLVALRNATSDGTNGLDAHVVLTAFARPRRPSAAVHVLQPCCVAMLGRAIAPLTALSKRKVRRLVPDGPCRT